MTKRQAQLAHSSGIQIMAIGVGKATNKRELRDIASDPDSEFVFDLNSFSALQAIKYRFADIACGGNMGKTMHLCCLRLKIFES